jgi:hypothetical protein
MILFLCRSFPNTSAERCYIDHGVIVRIEGDALDIEEPAGR